MNRFVRTGAAALLAALGACGFSTHAAAKTIYHLTDLGTLFNGDSEGYGVNASGQVTGGSNTFSNGYDAFLYSGGAMTDLGTLGGSSSAGYGINNAGEVTGYASLSGNSPNHAFLYSGGAMTDLGTLGGSFSAGYGINNASQVTGISYLTGDATAHAFINTGGVMTDLGALGGDFSQGNGINSLGQVTGIFDALGNTTNHAFVDTGGVMYDLNNLLDASSAGWVLHDAQSINDSGQITGYGNFGGLQHAYLLTPTIAVAPRGKFSIDDLLRPGAVGAHAAFETGPPQPQRVGLTHRSASMHRKQEADRPMDRLPFTPPHSTNNPFIPISRHTLILRRTKALLQSPNRSLSQTRIRSPPQPLPNG